MQNTPAILHHLANALLLHRLEDGIFNLMYRLTAWRCARYFLLQALGAIVGLVV